MRILALILATLFIQRLSAQDTFSIVAVDSATGEVGSAGASCLDDDIITGGVSIIKDVVPGIGAINTQASYNATNQTEASIRLSQGWPAQDIIDWLILNDAQGDSSRRQYGIARFDTAGGISTAAFTGSNCFNDKAQIVGPYYTIQGNILLGEYVLDSMEQRFLNSSGSLAERLMQALMGANFPGADSRCLNEGVSSQSAYLTVAAPNDPAGSPYLDLVVSKTPFGDEPIDSLYTLFEKWSLASAPSNTKMPSLKIVRNQGKIQFYDLPEYQSIELYSIDGKLLSTMRNNPSLQMDDPNPGHVLIMQLKSIDGVFRKKLAP